MTKLALHDVDVRRVQYLGSLQRVLESRNRLLSAVVLVENSGSDLAAFRELGARCNPYSRQVEFISLNANQFPRGFGKGYGEFSALDQALEQSRLLKSHEYFVKLTGRLVIVNMHAILRGLPKGFDMAADVHPNPRDAAIGTVDTRVLAFSRRFYLERVTGLYKEMDDEKLHYAEHAFYDLVRRNRGARIVPRLPSEPRWAGMSASMGTPYDSPIARLKYPLKLVRRAYQHWRGWPDLRAIWNTHDGHT